MQPLSHFLHSGLYFFRPQSPRKNAHSLLRYFGIRGICITSLPAVRFCRFAFENRKTPNISRNCSLSGRFWTFLFDIRGFTTVGNITCRLWWESPLFTALKQQIALCYGDIFILREEPRSLDLGITHTIF